MISSSDIPTTINSGEAGGYVFIGLKSRDNISGTAKEHRAKMLYAPMGKYQDMVKTKHLYNGLFNGMFNKLVILHDPTMPMAPEKEETKKVKGLSPKHKSIVNSMLENGAGENDESLQEMANELGITFERVKAYIQSF